jgi:SAM-dependent methyltransferase
VSDSFLRAFHAAHAGATARAFQRTGSYARLAALIPPHARVLDLACGNAALGDRIGLDLSLDELRLGSGARVQGNARHLPFADASFDAATCHLAFMLFDDAPRVVAEISRVLRPGGRFAALLGGGPTATGHDAFHVFLATTKDRLAGVALGDPRARSEHGWRALFAGWSEPVFERIELELGGTFEAAWSFLGASYQLRDADRTALRAELHARVGDHPSCRVVCWLATVTR